MLLADQITNINIKQSSIKSKLFSKPSKIMLSFPCPHDVGQGLTDVTLKICVNYMHFIFYQLAKKFTSKTDKTINAM
jgi:hypothetical protein